MQNHQLPFTPKNLIGLEFGLTKLRGPSYSVLGSNSGCRVYCCSPPCIVLLLFLTDQIYLFIYVFLISFFRL